MKFSETCRHNHKSQLGTVILFIHVIQRNRVCIHKIQHFLSQVKSSIKHCLISVLLKSEQLGQPLITSHKKNPFSDLVLPCGFDFVNWTNVFLPYFYYFTLKSVAATYLPSYLNVTFLNKYYVTAAPYTNDLPRGSSFQM